MDKQDTVFLKLARVAAKRINEPELFLVNEKDIAAQNPDAYRVAKMFSNDLSEGYNRAGMLPRWEYKTTRELNEHRLTILLFCHHILLDEMKGGKQ